MTRVNLYSAPHKALRLIMSDFCSALGRLSSTGFDELHNTKIAGRRMFRMLNEHSMIEDKFILSKLSAYNKSITGQDELEHKELEIIQNDLHNRFLLVGKDSTSTMINSFYLDFSVFMSKYFAHIYHEEMVTQLFLWDYFTDEELIQIRTEFIKSIDVELKLYWYEYMLLSQTFEENLKLLEILQASLTKSELDGIFQNIKIRLSGEAYEKQFGSLI